MVSMQCRHEMKVKLTTTVLAMLTVVGGSVAIAGLKDTPPQDVDLTALWKINAELSDDPQRVLAKKRDEGVSSGRGGGSSGGANTGIDIGDIFGGGTISGSVGGGGHGRGREAADPPDPPESMRVPLDSFLATREQLEIEQRPDVLTVRTLDETSTCKPAQTDKVPMPSGELADRRCGWEGGAFVIELKSADGVTRVNRYELRKNDQQLVVTSEIKGGRGQLSGLRIRRVYDRLVAF